jgi:bis(5'-nucleosyl)-tetraphosphatase (symmetrical)
VRWVVGDVQGCARELDDLVKWIRFDPQRDELWSLGDLINRGPDSLAVLRLWRDLGGRGLLGNHDIYALRAHAGREPRKGDTLEGLFGAADVEMLLARLREQPALIRLTGGDGVRAAWIVHAGLHPLWDDLDDVASRLDAAPHDDAWLTSPDVKFATRVRCCTADGKRCRQTGPPGACPPPHRPWDAFYRGPTLVVHGHWARRGAYRGPRTMGLDSGCVYGGVLTAWCQEEDRIAQVPSRERGGSPRAFDASHLPAGSPGAVPGRITLP